MSLSAIYLVFRRLAEVLIAFLAVWIFRVGYRFTRFRILRRVPGPPLSSVLWGHEWDLYNSPPGKLYCEWANKYGGVVQFDGCFGHRMLSVTSPRAVQHILSDDVYNWPKPEGARQWFLQLLGAGILYTEGAQAHQRQRRALAPGLNATVIRDLVPSFFKMAIKVADNWDNQIQKAVGDSVNVDAMFWANRISLDTIGLIGFSFDFDSLSGQALHPVAETLDNLTNSSTGFAAFVMKALVWQYPSILKIKSKKGKLIAKNREDLGTIASQVWNDALAAGEDGEASKTILSRLIVENKSKLDAERMGDEEIKDHIRTLISAGYETVSCTIAWALWEIARDTRVQDKLRETLPLGDPNFEEMHDELLYLDAVFKESLRLHPPILELHHAAAQDQAIPLDAPLPGTSELLVPVPKGTIVAIPVNVVQQDVNVWGTDADAFRPERWLEHNEKQSARDHLFELLAFSRGPRKCLGKIFAEAEIKALIVTLVRQFKLEPAADIEAFQSFVIRPRVKGQTESTLPLRISPVSSA